MSKDLLQQLKSLKKEASAGYVSESNRAAARDNLMLAIGARQTKKESWSPTSVFEFTRFVIGDAMSKPAMAFGSVFLIVLGSISTVNASANSLPGDPLYGLKVVTERTQLQLANSDRRAVLHTEFAERRLQELLELTTQFPERQDLINTTAEAYKREVAQISNNVEVGTPTNLVNVVQIDSRLNNLSQLVEQKVANGVGQSLGDATRDASNRVVNRVVENHESSENQVGISTQEIQTLFLTRFNAVNGRKTISLGRLSILEAHPRRSEVVRLVEINSIRVKINALSAELDQATNLAGSSGYRLAFETVNEVNNKLISLEAEIASLEQKLIDLLNPPNIEVDSSTTSNDLGQ
jgi:hypothetical protein